MKTFLEPLENLSGFSDMLKSAKKEKGLYSVTGCIDAQKPHMMYACSGGRKNTIIVTFHEQKAKELYEDYRFFDADVVYYPAKDVLFYQSDIRGNVLTAERIRALKKICEKEHVTVITTVDALMNTQAPPENVWGSVLTLKPGDEIVLDEVMAQLVRMGYEKEYQVETMGQFALRGGILDIFPLTEENPVRIEMWGDEIDTIRTFDTESQKSIENIEDIRIYPACELVLTEEEKRAGIEKLLVEAKKTSEKLRKEMKTEGAHRMLSMAEEKAEEWGELSIYAGMDAYLSYFCESRKGLLDYFNPEDTFILFDELTRCVERGKQTEIEFSESMKHRLEKGYIVPGQMKELFLEKEIIFTRLIDRNTTIPTRKSQVFSTAEDGQNAVTIRVFQGEREMAADNKLLGQFDLVGIPPAPRGMPQIEVTFDIDANGIVNVSAKDKATNKEQAIRIQASGGLSDADIEKMVKEAEANAAADKQKKETVEAKNQAEALVHTTEKTLKEHGDKISSADKQAIETELNALKTALEANDAAVIKEKTNSLMQASLKLGEAMYKAQAADAGAQGATQGADMGGASEQPKDDKVVDADFEEVK